MAEENITPADMAEAPETEASTIEAETQEAEAPKAKAPKKPAAKKQAVSKRTKPRAPKADNKGRGKKYVEAAKKVEADKLYTLDEALALAKDTSVTKFDGMVESHWNLGIDTKGGEQNIRAAISLPHGLGKTFRILVLTQGDKVKEAKDAGADFVGLEDMMEKIKGGWFDFDVLIASPDVMAKVGTLGTILGPKGLMPNPKVGTVNEDVSKAVKEFKAGKYEFKNDKDGLVHIPVGKVSFSVEQLKDNFVEIHRSLITLKPATSKGQYIKRVSVTTTMGPGIKVDLGSF
jgi:large subunit ribosomal protein L1